MFFSNDGKPLTALPIDWQGVANLFAEIWIYLHAITQKLSSVERQRRESLWSNTYSAESSNPNFQSKA